MVPKSIVLGSGRCITVGAYVRGLRAVIHGDPSATYREGLRGFGGANDGAGIRRDFRDAIHDRINRSVPWIGRGRKWKPNWQIEAHRVANDVNHPRLAIHWLPLEWRERFGHRLYRPD